jgi:hypothetical protein
MIDFLRNYYDLFIRVVDFICQLGLATIMIFKEKIYNLICNQLKDISLLIIIIIIIILFTLKKMLMKLLYIFLTFKKEKNLVITTCCWIFPFS